MASQVPSPIEGAPTQAEGSSRPKASEVLKKYKETFFDVVDAKYNPLRLKRENVISDSIKMEINNSDEEVAKEILFDHLQRNADVAALREYCRMIIAAEGYPKMQELGNTMLRELPPEDPHVALSTSAQHRLSPSLMILHWPEFRQLQHKFSVIVSKLPKLIRALNCNEFDDLLVYLRERMKPADLPKSIKTSSSLMEHLQSRPHWDYINIELAEDIIEHFCVNINSDAVSLRTLMKEYKETACSNVTDILEECTRKKVTPQPPKNFTTIAVEINQREAPLGDCLYYILEMKRLLVNNFGVRNSWFAGSADGSIVLYFFIPEEAVYSLCPMLMSYCATLQVLHVTTVVVFDHFAVDVCSQQMSLLHKEDVMDQSVTNSGTEEDVMDQSVTNSRTEILRPLSELYRRVTLHLRSLAVDLKEFKVHTDSWLTAKEDELQQLERQCKDLATLASTRKLLEKLENYSNTIQSMVKLTDEVLDISRELPTGETEGILELAIFAAEPVLHAAPDLYVTFLEARVKSLEDQLAALEKQ